MRHVKNKWGTCSNCRWYAVPCSRKEDFPCHAIFLKFPVDYQHDGMFCLGWEKYEVGRSQEGEDAA